MTEEIKKGAPRAVSSDYITYGPTSDSQYNNGSVKWVDEGNYSAEITSIVADPTTEDVVGTPKAGLGAYITPRNCLYLVTSVSATADGNGTEVWYPNSIKMSDFATKTCTNFVRISFKRKDNV